MSVKLVVLEGLDGAGKSTQVKLLRDYLEKMSPSLHYIHFPRYDSPVYGELIGKFLRGGFGSVEAVHPQLVALLYAEDRHGAAPEMISALRSGANVLLDRYVYSNIAYQCAKIADSGEADSLRQWIFDTEFGSFALPRPDLNLFLDVPLGFVESKLTSSREGDERGYLEGGAQDIHESSMDLQRRVRDMYRRQADLDPSFVRIDCADSRGEMLPPDAIFERIKTVVDKTFGHA